MKTLAIASGKGGTGKTSLAVAMFLANPEKTRLLDCDVEEPNCHLFLHQTELKNKPVLQAIPQINSDLCQLCGKCVRVCQFNALAKAGKAGIIVFEELCHSCGACTLACPYNAIVEVPRKIGEISQGMVSGFGELVTGTMMIGHSSAPSVIREVKKANAIMDVDYTIIDSPPGTACTFVAAVENADYVLLVTEATPFGLNDLKLAIEALKNMHLPFGVVINRSPIHENMVREYCNKQGIPVLLEIPDSRFVAETYAKGGSLIDALPDLKVKLQKLLEIVNEA